MFQDECQELREDWHSLESQVRRFDKRCISNVMMLNNLPLTITAQTLMVVSCVLCHCALTPSAGETRDRDLMYSAVGQVSRVKSTFTSPRWCICPSSQMSHLTLSLSNLSFSFSQVKLGCVCVCVRVRDGGHTWVGVAAHRWGFNLVCEASRRGLSQQRRCCVCFAGV